MRQPTRSLLSVSFLLFYLTRLSTSSPLSPPSKPCSSSADSFPFCNSSLPISARAQALVSLLTLDEKIEQLSNSAGAVPRLGIPAYEWWSESLHGLAPNGPGVLFNGSIHAATVFPQVILTAASFNRSLWRSVACAIATEARAMHNEGQAGLTFWAPNINIFRDPRWGRGQETPGEDPLVASSYSVQYVKGFQNMNKNGQLMLSACCKHFTAYDLEKWKGFARYTFNAQVTEQDMEDTYQPPFKSCIKEGQASCLMCSYNQVNGIPACANADLLQQARDEWGFEGYITSDCDAVAIIYEDQTYSNSPEDSIADVLKAGMDINCGTYLLRYTKSAIEKSKIQETDIDKALINLFSVQLRLGLFDSLDQDKNKWFMQLDHRNVCTENHRKLALESAKQGLVLLKNENGLLPLDKREIRSVALIGPAGNDTYVLGGDYTGNPCDPVSFLEGIKNYVQNTDFAPGCTDMSCNTTNGFNQAIIVASKADFVVIIAGLNLTEETEDLDRTSLLLPGNQMELVNEIGKITKRPLVLVLMGGGPLDVSFAKNNENIGAIIWIGYPGETAGLALAKVLFGDYNPGGRLPVTWYPESFTDVPMNDMNMRADPSRSFPGRTYRFYTGETVYNFGHGLSYSNISHKILSAPNLLKLLSSHSINSQKIVQVTKSNVKQDGLEYVYVQSISSCDALKFNVKVSVYNHGDMDGTHVLLLFVKPKVKMSGHFVKQLIGFERVVTSVGVVSEVQISVNTCEHLTVADEKGKRVILLGEYLFMLEDIEHEFCVEA
ncbi:hypothetical protein LUZ60_016617 [Juncus effusus]|nr:hypothetical protein LUZ60_016617 [Juncus effusus]